MRPLLFAATALTLLCMSPLAYAEPGASSVSSASSGSGGDIWAARSARAASFGPRWTSFAPLYASWMTKWQKAHSKLTAHIARCHDSVRSANRDTLLTVTLQCERTQLLTEKDALTIEREIIAQWPNLSEDRAADMLAKIDALSSAMQTVVDGIDAHVFPTLAALRDVRRNLLTQYRQPYWLAGAHLRVDISRTWVAHLLLTLQAALDEGTPTSEGAQALGEAVSCYTTTERMLENGAGETTVDRVSAAVSEARALFTHCRAFLDEAQRLSASSSSASSQ